MSRGLIDLALYSGLSLDEITADELTVEATTAAVKDFWPMERELLATIVELLHALLITTAKAHGAKRTPDQIKIPRPSRLTQEEQPLGAQAFTGHMMGSMVPMEAAEQSHE